MALWDGFPPSARSAFKLDEPCNDTNDTRTSIEKATKCCALLTTCVEPR